MDKIYKILIINLYNELLGAFTDMDAFEKVKFLKKKLALFVIIGCND